ncbi:hypothetical protein A9Q99_16505 [Gammaproteobacteria bacterium 45_16_T64]|nr:hypothetical protein A9Q99_16505 [Gammaproteobacteria bacterium 45_16_T64]
MHDTLNILIIDDSSVDEMLLRRVLKKEGFQFVHARVDNEDDMSLALKDHWDIAISDCHMPCYTPEKALSQWREYNADRPFILVSGAIGEEEAALLMKLGANDFIKKDNLARLSPVINREMQEYYERQARREAEEALAESIELYGAIIGGIEQAGAGLLIVDDNLIIHFMNGVMVRWFGDHHQESVHHAFTDTIVEEVFSPLSNIFTDHQLRQFNVVTENKTHYKVIATPIRGSITASEGPGRVMLMMQDVTEEKRSEHQLNQAAAVFRSAAEGVMITDTKFLILATNEAYSSITGYAENESIGFRPRLTETTQQLFGKLKEIKSHLKRNAQWQGEVRSQRKNGETFPAWVTISKVADHDGDIANYVLVFSDISSIKKSQDQLAFLSHHDSLTKLPNRLLLLDRIQQSITRAKRSDRSIAILYIDLDRFKNINESLGHVEGDHLLQMVAERLGKLIRKEDTLARLGGDEFIIHIEDVTSPEVVSNFTQKILSTFLDPFTLDTNEFRISASIGIALYPGDGDSPDSLIRNADTAMYRAKDQGKDTYQFYTADMNARTLELLRLENDLRKAVNKQQFELYYQPQFHIESGKLIGMEALIRWFHPKKDMISPADFIPIAEETGTIIPIGEWVIKTACHQLSEWNRDFDKCLTVAVNLSPRQFGHHRLLACIDEAISSSGLPAQCLEVEITEGVLVEDVQAAIEILEQLNSMGIKTSIDDFGTGYSSLAYLKRFPISKLKIDQSFVKDIKVDSNDEAIVTSIIRLGQSMDMQVIAEGVETEAQLKFLLEQGCDEGQGYYLGRPVNAAEFVEKFLR